MSLESLANELIGEIIRHIPHPQTNLSLCSKRLHVLTEPIIYTNVTLRHKASYPTFIRTIAERPDLVPYARHFQTSAHTAGWDFDLSFLQERTWIRRTLSSICGERICNNWFREIFAFKPHDDMSLATSWDAITAFLLCLFSPGLRSIHLEPYGFLVTKYPRIDMVMEQISRVQSKLEPMNLNLLSNLTSVSIKGNQTGIHYQPRGLSVKFVIPFLQVKSVSKVQISNICNEYSTTFSFLCWFLTLPMWLSWNRLSPPNLFCKFSLRSTP
jgi:hypothetical protein